jgi:hypothetical protein
MPFTASSFSALLQTSSFSLWHYRTADSRATATTAGYFSAVAAQLKAGDLMILQAADALALLPVRVNAGVGTGVTLDGAVGPLAVVRSATQGFSIAQAAAAVVRGLVLAPLTAAVVAGAAIPASATVIGPVASVVFTLRDAAGTVIPPVRTVTVVSGRANTSFSAPSVGTGYRIRVEDAADSTTFAQSATFSVGAAGTATAAALLLESGSGLLTEAGATLVQQ